MKKLGKFEIREQLGQGGMGVVYRAWDTRMERLVALKTISPDKATRADFVKRFRREAQSAGRLDHPNIVTVYEFDEQDDVCYIAMQFLEGSDLESLLSSPRWDSDFPLFRKLEVLIEICQGLGYAHRNGVIHRDVKPANIMVLTDGTAKIVDFGIARLGEGTSGTSNLLLGTAPYMAPEQLEGHAIDERVDIFAVGVIAYRLFTRHLPFDAPSVSGILYKIAHEPPAPLAEYLVDYPAELENILFTALAKDRDQRYRTMDELSFELQRLLNSLNTSLVVSYVEESRKLVLLHDFERAKNLLRKVLELEPSNPAAIALWQQVQQALQQEHARRKAQQLLSDGIEAYERGDWMRALDCFQRGVQLEPSHEVLQTYYNLTLRERDKIAAIAENLKTAREAVNRKDLTGARQCLSRVLDINPENTEAQRLLSEVEGELAEIERRRNAQQYLDRAQQALHGKQFGEALSFLDKAKALDPEGAEAARLRTLILGEQSQFEQQKVRAEKIAAAQAALDRGEYDSALHHADVGLRAFPNDPALQQLQSRANQGLEGIRRRKQIDEHIELARTLVERGDLAGAKRAAAAVREKDPQEPRLASLQQAVSRLEEKQEREQLRDQELERARELVRANRAEEARDLLVGARDRFGRSAAIQELLAYVTQEVKRAQEERQVQDTLRQASAFLEADAPDKAAQVLRKAVKKLKQPVLAEELQRVEKLAKEAAQRTEFLNGAAALIQKGQWMEALSMLGGAPENFRSHARYRELWQKASAGARAAGTPQDDIATGVVEGQRAGRPSAGSSGLAPHVASSGGAAAAPALARESAPAPAVAPAPRHRPLWIYVAVAAVAATLLAALAVWRLSDRFAATVPSPAATANGTLRIDIAPWAELREVRNTATGERIAAQGETPLELALPAGSYEVVVAHPALGELKLQVTIQSGAARTVRQKMPGFDPATVLKKYE